MTLDKENELSVSTYTWMGNRALVSF